MQDVQNQGVTPTPTGLNPASLTPRELLRYAYLELSPTGLPKNWCEALITQLARALDR
jgi:hypothetical protein